MVTPPLPDKKYSVIYADPPWDYESETIGTGKPIKIDCYPTMTLRKLCELPVESIAKNDCLLFMWSTAIHLPDALTLGDKWGFRYITVGFAWDKVNPLIGHYNLTQMEWVLLFKRGKIPQPRGKRNIRQFLSCKKGSHSVKPLEIAHRITEMFPTQSKIELFARPMELTKIEGWDYWGNEV